MEITRLKNLEAFDNKKNLIQSGSNNKLFTGGRNLQQYQAVASGSGIRHGSNNKKEVIDISDSSDDEIQRPPMKKRMLSKGVSNSSSKGKAKMDIIELSDSDDELPSMSNKKSIVKKFVPVNRSSPSTPPQIVQPKPQIEPEAIILPPPIIAPVVVAAVVPPKVEVAIPSQEDLDLASILSIIPDVLPEHALKLLQDPIHGHKVEIVLEILFSAEYPKVEKIGNGGNKGQKRPREEEKVVVEKNWLEYKQEGGMIYREAAVEQLCCEFEYISKIIVRQRFNSNFCRFAPTYTQLQTESTQTSEVRGWKELQSGRKGKGRVQVCEELELEMNWLRSKLEKESNEKAVIAEEERISAAEIARGEFFECINCYGDSGFSQVVTCTDGCSFCKECFIAHTNTQVGLRQFLLPCLSGDCTSTFGEAEMARILSTKTLAALHKIKQEKEIDLAEIGGLTKCPFCPFACIIENENERLLICQREDCGITSCRQCKKENHLPRTCAEMDTDKKIDGLHKIEESMSDALIRRCPNKKCNEPYIKEDGCNKITCSSCRTMSCYICEVVVTGYEHFANAGTNATHTIKGATCQLWDDSKGDDFNRVEAARIAAIANVAKNNPAINEEDHAALALAAPPPPPAHIAAHIAAHQPRVVPLKQQRAQARAEAQVQARLQARVVAGGYAQAQAEIQARVQAQAEARAQMKMRIDALAERDQQDLLRNNNELLRRQQIQQQALIQQQQQQQHLQQQQYLQQHQQQHQQQVLAAQLNQQAALLAAQQQRGFEARVAAAELLRKNQLAVAERVREAQAAERIRVVEAQRRARAAEVTRKAERKKAEDDKDARRARLLSGKK